MKIVYVFVIVLLALVTCSQMAMAQIPRTISYQGVLADNAGIPKPDGSYQLTFRLYDVGSGGSALWTEVKTLLTNRGLFSTALGDQVPIPYSIKFDQQYWLGIQVAADPELTPRIPLTAVGYSLNSSWADTARVGLMSIEQIDTLILGSPTQNGRIIVYKNGSLNPIVDIKDYSNSGGSVIITDELGNNVGRFRPSGMGTGGTVELYRNTTGSLGFYAGGNNYGDEEGYVKVYGSQRSATFYMGATANASVVLPDSSISSDEILDEPGVAATQIFGYTFTANTNVQQISSVTIDVPSPGKIILQATGYVYMTHTTGTDETANINIGTTATTNPYTYGVARFTIPSGLPTDIYRWPFSCYRIFNAPSAGPVTFYLVGQQNQVFSNLQCNYSVFTAIYYPTVYGSTPLAAPSSATQSLTPGPEENMTPDNVTYQTAAEFKAYKKQVFQTEIDKLKDQVEKLEQQINDQNDK